MPTAPKTSSTTHARPISADRGMEPSSVAVPKALSYESASMSTTQYMSPMAATAHA